MKRPSKLLIIPLVFLTSVLLFILPELIELAKPNEIFEIKNTRIHYTYFRYDKIVIGRNFMITNPSNNLNEVKNSILNFMEHYQIEIDKDDMDKYKMFELYFYRRSIRLPRNWQPTGGHFATDYLDSHNDDLVASIYWTDSDNYKKYSIYKRNNGKIIDEINGYIN